MSNKGSNLNALQEGAREMYGEEIFGQLVAASENSASLDARQPHSRPSSTQQRVFVARLSTFEVTLEDIETRISLVAGLSNFIPGPIVRLTEVRGYGLFADRDYVAGEVITTYEGVITKCCSGDYLAYCGDGLSIDGHHGFTLKAKGRWINESDRERTVVNATLGRTVRSTRDIKAGEEIFVDYGIQYVRTY